MVGKYTNDYLIQNTTILSSGQILFFQKMMELLNHDTPVHSSYRIHNSYTILCELKSIIDDYYKSKINALSVVEVISETKDMFDNEPVISMKDTAFYNSMKMELRKKVDTDSKQSFTDESLANLSAIYHAIVILKDKYSSVDYQKNCIHLLKSAIDAGDRNSLLVLCQSLLSSLLYNGRTIRNIRNDMMYYFEKSNKTFEENWNMWASILVRYNTKYTTLIELPEPLYYLNRGNIKLGIDYKTIEKEDGKDPTKKELIKDEKKYFISEITAPANDVGYIVKAAFEQFLPVMAPVDFSAETKIEHPASILYFDVHRNTIYSAKYEDAPYQFRPYKQYRKSISVTLSELLENVNKVSSEDYSKLLRGIACVSSLQTKNLEHNYLILWSAVETLFRSSQAKTAISSIRTALPHSLGQRYIYYLVFDFIKSCKYCEVISNYRGDIIDTDNPKDSDIETMCNLLRDEPEVLAFISICEAKYYLLAEQAKELKNILENSFSIKHKIEKHSKILSYNLQRMYRVRNKLVHHSEVDQTMEALYKHLTVYLWESIREMSYVSKKNSIYNLESIFTYFRIGNTSLLNKLQKCGIDFDFNLLKWE